MPLYLGAKTKGRKEERQAGRKEGMEGRRKEEMEGVKEMRGLK